MVVKKARALSALLLQVGCHLGLSAKMGLLSFRSPIFTRALITHGSLSEEG